MRKYLVKGLVSGLFILLTGCQSNTMSTDFFSRHPLEANVAQSVREALMRSDDPVLAQVHVDTVQNTVVLSGYVKKIRQSDTAEQIARQVPGVQMVENNIIVRP